MAVVSQKIYTTKKYCKEYLGFVPDIKGTEDELRNILDEEGYDEVWDFPLDEIDEIVENDHDVVLVDTSYTSSKGKKVTEHRWFEIPA